MATKHSPAVIAETIAEYILLSIAARARKRAADLRLKGRFVHSQEWAEAEGLEEAAKTFEALADISIG